MAIIGHVDLDAFFASVEEREKPYLKGRPVVVGADPAGGVGRGIVSTANYKARLYGVKSAMPIQEAWRRAKRAEQDGEKPFAFLTPSFSLYAQASEDVFSIVRAYVPKIERVSVDEAYLDLNHYTEFQDAKVSMEKMRKEIFQKTDLTVSVGIGKNKPIAKIASDFKKPNGLSVVLPEESISFLAILPVRAIPGVGPKSEQALYRLGMRQVADIQGASESNLRKALGVWGRSIYRKALGEGSDVVMTKRDIAKSISKDRTFSEDISNPKELFPVLTELAESLHKRMIQKGFFGFRTAALTVRFSDFETRVRSITSSFPLTEVSAVERVATKLLLPYFERKENPEGKAIRMIGLRIENLI